MELSDCFDDFMRGLSSQDHNFITRLEAEARNIRSMILVQGSKPLEIDLHRAKNFLLDVEKWKADCLEELTGNAIRNEPGQIWSALHGAVTAISDLDALISIMNLIGFGSSRDEETGQRRAKRATAVLRFLDPDEWGVVDWRTIAILSLYEKNGYDMDRTVERAKRKRMQEMASLFDLVDEAVALDVVKKYRSLRNSKIPRTVNVELASRFEIKHLEPYIKEDFVVVAERVLIKRENTEPEIARLIAATVAERSLDIRDVLSPTVFLSIITASLSPTLSQ